ncbi:FecR family protein [Carboxylicivirga taeanensis]|uniref:FecR family protein n=1 Tax=Carboxylicivirga taeanensis TaxID=1416875 RepID=UPI003F6E1698
MKTEKHHMDQRSNGKDWMNLLPELDVNYARSKEEVWHELELVMEDTKADAQAVFSMGTTRRLPVFGMAVAALLMVLFATTAFLRFYAKTVHAESGQHLTALLPDGSSITLNAGSVIQYHPLWWRFNREVEFHGEGFFEVEKGRSFEVVSSIGRTVVLGTSFNIYARKNAYKVTCYSGKVRVVSAISGDATEITPNMQAYIQSNGSVVSAAETNAQAAISWMNGLFYFTATPLEDVFEEVERQYGVRIHLVGHFKDLYTGNFSRNCSADQVMRMICQSMGLNFEPTPLGYQVSH